MSAPVDLPSAIRYHPSLGKFEVYKGNRWVDLDTSVVENLPATPVAGVATGYKVARGVHQQAAASDTIATGLSTVVAAVVSFQDAPTANIFAVAADIGDQAGAPVAGSILIKAYKTPATPVAATVFSDNIHVAWVAWGT